MKSTGRGSSEVTEDKPVNSADSGAIRRDTDGGDKAWRNLMVKASSLDLS